MKLLLACSLVSLTSFAISGVNACWQVHAFYGGDPFTGDVLVVQAKNNDVELCNSGGTKYFSSGETVWTVTCGTLTFTMTNNGQAGHVSDPDNGYEADLVLAGSQQDTVDCYCNDETCLNCLQVESCLNDAYSNCGDYPACAFCDYKSYC